MRIFIRWYSNVRLLVPIQLHQHHRILVLLRIVLALVVAAVSIIIALFAAPGIHSDVRVEAVLAVVLFAAVFVIIAWAMKPP